MERIIKGGMYHKAWCGCEDVNLPNPIVHRASSWRFTLYTRSPISIDAPFKLSPILDEATSMVYMRSTMILSF
ncbi:hypothetical protein L1887_37383 [Cichorium endivia]|nr:hypothetical protein L1887_37383 [Cichorium endivia]